MERMLLIGNPDNRRTAALQDARRRLGLPPAELLSYAGLLAGGSLTGVVQGRGWERGEPPLLRLDAPGELFPVERGLIALGAPDGPTSAGGRDRDRDDRLLPFGGRPDPEPLSMAVALALPERQGRLYHPSQWFRGFGRLLGRLEREAAELWPGGGRWMNDPADIAAMFDKRRTHRLLSAAGVPVPPLLAPPEALPDYAALRERMAAARMPRVFIKLACGSGASGVVTYQLNPASGGEIALTTMAAEPGPDSGQSGRPVYSNAIRLRRYTDRADIRPLVDWLLRHGAHVERWIPKAARGDRSFDIRQLVVLGEACHSVARVSRTPITNLHLRSERMEPAALGLPDAALAAVRDCAERALAAFPRSGIAGIDVMLDAGGLKPFVADVNPFGDLLYRTLHRGFDPYEWELRRYAAAAGTGEGRPA